MPGTDKLKNDTNAPVCFVESLNVLSWVKYVLPYLLCQSLRRHKVHKTIYYIDATKAGKASAQLGGSLFGFSVEEIQFRLVEIKDKDGVLLRLRVHYFDLFDVQKDILKNPAITEFLENDIIQKSRIGSYLEKQAIDFMWNDASTALRMLLLIHVVIWKADNDIGSDAPKIFFANRRFWTEEVKRYAQRYNVTIIPVRKIHLHLKDALIKILGEQRLRSLYYAFRQHGLKGLFKKPDTSQTVSFPKLMVEYYGHLNLDRPEFYSDLFFWQKSPMKGEDVLIGFNIPADPIDKTKLEEIKKHKMSAVALNPRATTQPEVPVFLHWGQNTKINELKSKLKFPKHNPVVKKWLNQQIAGYSEQFDYWTDLFSQNNIKLYLTWYKYDAKHCIIADALESLGGVTAIYQRALEEFPSTEATIAADVLFGFSKLGIDVEQKSHSTIPYYIITGYSGDHRFGLLQSKAMDIKKRLRHNGAKRIIAFFDENSHDDSRWLMGHQFMRENYEFLFKKALREPWLGLVLKPKAPSTLRKRLGPLLELLERLEEEGRCYVFEGGTLHGSYPPAVAALAADVAVHGHLCAATAGFEAALTGTPTLLLDREGWPGSSLYQLGKETVVFTQWENIWCTCMEHWHEPGGIPGFGDWSSMLETFDPFRDGRGAERIGAYLNWLLEGLKDNLPREKVLANAAERYAKAWGYDKVNEVGPHYAGIKKLGSQEVSSV